ncbi:MAG: hypothetical protein JSW34_12495 [Candidatus Zixiibacteriota bacterium]|nr:MAG: hypothetical protein JSW34_12495 [candidate division Zixibacteria bacterium]
MLGKPASKPLFLLVAALLAVPRPGAQDAPDPVLEFYCERAASTFPTRDPIESGADFSFRATTFYKSIGENGEVTGVDSGIADYFYSSGELDSLAVVLAPRNRQKDIDLTFLNVFSGDYDFYFFPNDTGGSDLAIGFDTYTGEDPAPVGLAVIDRTQYLLRRLHLHYPNRKYHKRYSRSFRFVERDGYIFADSVWVVSAKKGVFTTDFFRIETGITNIRVRR